MAEIVLGVGSSHTPMLNAKLEDWPRFIELDRLRPHLDRRGNPVDYAGLLALADAKVEGELAPEVLAAKHRAALAHVERLGEVIRRAEVDTLIVVGDDQKELYHTENLPAVLVYHGASIRNVPLTHRPGPTWAKDASARYYEPETPKDYPVDRALAAHLIAHLVDAEFDVAVADDLPEGKGEGHAFGFVHRRLLDGADVPVVPIFLNTYYPPNQPTPRRCHRLGRALRDAVRSFAGERRIGVVASGGLSHFTVDEALDARVMQALRDKDGEALGTIPRELLNSGNSEIRNWICMAAATDHLALRSMDYIPAYRTPAGTGTGLCFAVWQ